MLKFWLIYVWDIYVATYLIIEIVQVSFQSFYFYTFPYIWTLRAIAWVNPFQNNRKPFKSLLLTLICLVWILWGDILPHHHNIPNVLTVIVSFWWENCQELSLADITYLFEIRKIGFICRKWAYLSVLIIEWKGNSRNFHSYWSKNHLQSTQHPPFWMKFSL